jgi:ATP-dependent helicase HepA
VAPICRSSFGVLLLTATPVRLDPREYFRLLSLVEPVASTTEKEFLARLDQHDAYADVARGLLAGAAVGEALALLRKLSPDDDFFSRAEPLPHRLALLAHLADRYSLSARLVRNRRVKVGAFTARTLRRADVAPGTKRQALVDLCARLAGEGEKVLVFGHDVDALRDLQAGIAVAGREALLYDDAATIEARDRLVARFRDPEGPAILLSGESGGEGRNFQFAHHLVCADLPASPLVLEQRIGRLDRLGQTRPVEIHLVVEEGDEAFLADLYEKEIGIFDEPVGGLDAVLASLPDELAALGRKRSARTREAFRKDLAERVAAARKAQHEGDPLLDIRSAALPDLARLVRAAFDRLGEDPPEGIDTPGEDAAEAISEALVTLSRWLEEELEDVAADIGRRVGMEVDTDQNVHPFEVAFTLGAGMRIEALPGMELPEEPLTILGSFWRETAVARDELQWFATGHRLVEALIGLVRDGDAGRSAAVKREWAPRRGALYVRFLPALASSADVAPGARVASRQASRYLDLAPISVLIDLDGNRPVRGGAVRLEGEIDEAEGARVGGAPKALLDAARAAAEKEAGAILARRVEEAKAMLLAHAEGEEERLIESSFQGGAPRKRVDAALAVLRQHRDVVEKSIGRAKLELDAVALVVP